MVKDVMTLHEKHCIPGSIGTIYSKQPISLVPARALKLDKYGA